MFRIFIPKTTNISPGLILNTSLAFGEYDLTAFTHANGPEYVLALGRYAFARLLLVVMDQVVEFHIIQFCQRVTVQYIGY